MYWKANEFQASEWEKRSARPPPRYHFIGWIKMMRWVAIKMESGRRENQANESLADRLSVPLFPTRWLHIAGTFEQAAVWVWERTVSSILFRRTKPVCFPIRSESCRVHVQSCLVCYHIVRSAIDSRKDIRFDRIIKEQCAECLAKRALEVTQFQETTTPQ